jgi:hypothetical protein
MNRQPLWIFLVLILAASISACGSTSKKTTPPPAITIAITTAPPASLTVNGTASIAATVTNDTAAAGVDWTCTPTATCGSFNPAHTASAAATVFTASATAGAIVITAASTTTPTITATADVTVNAATVAMGLVGPYTYQMNGWDSVAPYSVVGTVVLDGNGNITGGEQDSFNLGEDTIFTTDAIQPSTGAVVIGTNGQGTITITPTLAHVETLSVTVVNNSHVLITEFDLLATTTGTMDLQTAPTSVPTGGNAFAVFDVADAFAYGGVFTSDGASTITAGEGDASFQGDLGFDQNVAGFFSTPDASGRGTINLTIPSEDDGTDLETMQFAYYVVGPKVYRLVEIDGDFFASGSVYGQGTATFSSTSLGGSFVFGLAGDEDFSFGTYAAAGQFTGDGTSAFSAGVMDINDGDGPSVLAGSLIDAEYFAEPNGYAGFTVSDDGGLTDGLSTFGVYLVDPALNITDPNSTTGGGGALMIELDDDNVGSGIVVPQTSGATFTGNYAITQDGFYAFQQAASQFDLIGQVSSDGTSTFSGLADFNDISETGLNPGITISATYAADVANPGRITAVLVPLGTLDIPDTLTLYQANSSLLLNVGVASGEDFITISLGVLEQQQEQSQ